MSQVVRLVSLILLACAWFAIRAPGQSLLILSDVHFNPLADQSLKQRLTAADPGSWDSLLSQTRSQAISKSGEDTNWPLLQSVLHRAATLPTEPKFVLITGDLFAHHLREKFESDPVPSSGFSSFAEKTAVFLAREFKTAFPRVPILIALGNNDGDCREGDYSIQPGGTFLRNTLAAIAQAAEVTPADLEDSWMALGSYDIPHPASKHTRIVVLNTTFFSWRYQNVCGDQGDDPGDRLLTWLQNRLISARARHEKVWLVYHIPPGIDGYASTHARAPNADRIVTMWKPQYQAKFERIVSDYALTVQTQFAGHTHFDDFRLLGTPGSRPGFVLISPGISPNVRQNPAFREVRFRSDGTLTDFDTWYLPLSQGRYVWTLGYQFRREWNFKVVDLASLATLYSQILASPQVRGKWEDIYSVWSSGHKPMAKRDFAATLCASGNTHVQDFRTCFCQMSGDAAFCKN